MYRSVSLLVEVSLVFILFSASVPATAATSVPDLAKISQNEEWAVYNRTATFVADDPQGRLSFDAQPEAGLAWLKQINLGDGVIEADVKGTDEKDKSYLGIAFRGQNEKVYEAVYFRPFNFNAPDALHRSHSVQYIAEPDHPWETLRKEQPGHYESAVLPPVNPNDFFHVKIVLEQPQVRVYINDSSTPTLTVETLGQHKSGWVGFWLGKHAGGVFKNLKITPKLSQDE